MLPVIALVGRPNVGKSTLFNRVTRTRDALVADVPGLTRDRQYGDGRVGERPFIVIDTGGLSGETDDLDGMMAQQAWQAIEDSEWARDLHCPGGIASPFNISATINSAYVLLGLLYGDGDLKNTCVNLIQFYNY